MKAASCCNRERWWHPAGGALALLLAFTTLTARAAGENPADFARSMLLTPQAPATYYRLAMPAEVYLGNARSDLGDVRVFNDAGEVLPYTLLPPLRTPTPDTSQPVPYFAQSERQQREGKDTRISNDGTLTQVAERPASELVASYVFDISRINKPVSGLNVAWQDAGFSGDAVLEGSNDLQHWQWLASRRLMALEYLGTQLVQQRIDFPAARFKYLRLVWQGPAPQLTRAYVRIPAMPDPPRRLWEKVNLSTDGQDYRFTSPIRNNIDSLRITLPNNGTLLRASLQARSESNRPWQILWQGVLYRLADNDYTQLELNTDASEFRLQIDRSSGSLGQGQPEIAVGWPVHMLIFTPHGSPPYTLAFGNAQIRSAALTADELRLNHKSNIAGVEIGPVLVNPHPPADRQQQQRWLLWGALLLAVGVLGLMVRSLWQGLRQSADK